MSAPARPFGLPVPDDIAADLPALLERALAEDAGPGDVTTAATVPEGTVATGRFLVKEDGVVAGLAVAERVFAAVDPALRVSWTAADGDRVEARTTVGEVRGCAASILTAERLALNLVQRMSGIATAAHAMAHAARPAVVLDTRKTAPGLRLLDKWAVALGGAANHRVGLFDRVLVKDNHIEAAGGVRAALAAVTERAPAGIEVEIEARTLEEVEAVLAAKAEGLHVDTVLLDNLVAVRADGFVDTSLLAEAVRLVGGRVKTEASGTVTLATVAAIAATGVDFVSSGALTHSVRALDVSLKITLGDG